MRLLVIVIALLSPALSACCYWDRDTLAIEVEAAPRVFHGIVFGGHVNKPSKLTREEALRYLKAHEDASVGGDGLARLDVYSASAWSLRLYDEVDATLQAIEHNLSKIEGKRDLVLYPRVLRGMTWLHRFFHTTDVKRADLKPIAEIMGKPAELTNVRRDWVRRAIVVQALLRWAAAGEKHTDGRMLPDAFNLRTADWLALADNKALADRGLGDAPTAMADLLFEFPDFVNVDTLHALALLCMVDGKQFLATFARFRAWELIDAGDLSRVPESPSNEALKLAVTPRKPEGRGLQVVQLHDDTVYAELEENFKQWRGFVLRNERRFGGSWYGGMMPHPPWPESAPPISNKKSPPPPDQSRKPPKSGGNAGPAQGGAGTALEVSTATVPVAEQPAVVKGGIPSPDTTEPGRVRIGGLQVHWLGLVIGASLLVALVLVFVAWTHRGKPGAA